MQPYKTFTHSNVVIDIYKTGIDLFSYAIYWEDKRYAETSTSSCDEEVAIENAEFAVEKMKEAAHAYLQVLKCWLDN